MTTPATKESATEPSYSNKLLLASSAMLVGTWLLSQIVLIPYVAHLLLLVVTVLYTSCHASLMLRHEPPPGSSLQRSERETMRAEDAYQFPIVGSICLFSLYLCFKFLPPDYVNLVANFYFGVISLLALFATMSAVTNEVTDRVPVVLNNRFGWQLHVPHPLPTWLGGDSPWDLSADFSGLDIFVFLGAGCICGLYFHWNKPWYLNNLLGLSFCLQGLQRFSLGTFQIGAILLVGLFFYDIFWVFRSDAMVLVAKSLNGPIKLLFPRDSLEPNASGKVDCSLLGLGDIVIPGFFLAFLLRFDAHRAGEPQHPIDVFSTFPRPYFNATLLAYIAGLATTLVMMVVFEHAQPALLYLVPACLGASLGCAVWRGEMKELWAYSEEEHDEADIDGEAKKDQ